MLKKAFKAAWPHTLPVLAGYAFLGIAFGFLMKTKGFPIWYPIVMSLLIFSGALEFAAVPLLSSPFAPLSSLIMGLMISARHLFYGIPMLKKYANAGRLKGALIFTLTDENFSILTTVDPPEGVEPRLFYFAVSLLNYFYWVGSTILGTLFGSLVSFDTTGVDFALTALFIVLFMEQIKTRSGRLSGFIGLVATAAALALFGSQSMVLIAMGLILTVLLLARKGLDHD